jgi:membrane protease YdiL (CAAX protease family)
MRKTTFSGNLTNQETMGGFVYLVFQLLFLGPILSWINAQLQHPLTEAELNFVFYLVNFIAILLIFHDFLGRALNQATRHPVILFEAVVLGLAAYYVCTQGITWLVRRLVPGFHNYNDEAIAAMRGSNFFLMAIGTVVLVPPVEECLYRGLIFRNLYKRSPLAAYIVSILAFSIIHIVGYIGVYEPLELLMAFLQYLPAGLCLAWGYMKADTIFAPILIHAIINAVAIGLVR